MWQREHLNLLPRTAQTVSSRTGDDGDFEAGWTGTARFRDNGDGTIFDRATGLVWVKEPQILIPGAVGIHATNQIQVARGNWADSTAYAKADLAAHNSKFWVCIVAHTGPGDASTDPDTDSTHWRETIWTSSAADLIHPATMAWNAAIDNCLALEYAGYTDWRLPNAFELISLYDLSVASPCIKAAAFPNTQTATAYWSASVYVSSPASYAHYAQFGAAINASIDLKTVVRHVRPVRGGRLND